MYLTDPTANSGALHERRTTWIQTVMTTVLNTTSTSPKTAIEGHHGGTQDGSGSSSVTGLALVLVEMPKESVWIHHGQHQDGQFVVSPHMSRTPGINPPPPLPHNLQELFDSVQAAWDGLSQDTFRNLSALHQDVRHVGLANIAVRRHTERHYFCMCSSINISHISLHVSSFIDLVAFIFLPNSTAMMVSVKSTGHVMLIHLYSPVTYPFSFLVFFPVFFFLSLSNEILSVYL